MKCAAIASLLLLGCEATGSSVVTPVATVEQPAPEVTSAPVAEAPPPEHRIVKARDPRKSTLHPRARALLITELQGLERLLAYTPPRAPDRPQLTRRLAEDYAELARAIGRDPRGAEANAHRKAIAYYQALETWEYPAFDEAIYFEGLEREAAGDFSGARRAYYMLIEHAPESKLVPYTYFAFGELFDAEGKNDLALLAYQRAIEHPESPIAPDAFLRIGRTYERLGDPTQARAAYDRVLADFPKSDAAAEVPAL
jgi:TolA-binding protein